MIPGSLKSVCWVAAFVAAACGGKDSTGPRDPPPPVPAVGSIEVTTVTTGASLDTEYRCLLDSSPGETIDANTTTVFSDLRVGDHTIELVDVASNCAVAGANPRTLNVSANATARTTFRVTCTLAQPSDPDPGSPFPHWLLVEDPVGDHTGSVDVTSMLVNFDDVTGDYEIVLQADAANPFVGSFRVNINLFNPGVGTTAQYPSFFSDTMRDYSLGGTSQTELRLTGSNAALTAWGTGDRVFTNSLAGTGNPDGISLFRSSVGDPGGGFLTDEDVIAFADRSRPAVVQTR